MTSNWTNNDQITVYHGTDDESADKIKPLSGTASTMGINRIDLKVCHSRTDFGRGFYTTTNRHQAENWANTGTRRQRFRHMPTAVVMEFRVSIADLSNEKILTFVRPGEAPSASSSGSEYWRLVSEGRSGGQPFRDFGHTIIFGPVSLWPQYLVIADCDQVSFHIPRFANTKLKYIATHRPQLGHLF